MSSSDNKFEDISYITYNSLISISVVSEYNDNKNYSKYLIAEENLEQKLKFKLCKNPLVEYSNLKSSYFYIRDIGECKSIFGIPKNGDIKSLKKEENANKELGFITKDKINQNSLFYLQHMMTKKFISIEKKDNKFVLKLLKNIDSAANFSLVNISIRRNWREPLSLKEIYYLSITFKEDGQSFYVEDDKNEICENNNKYFDILMYKNPNTRFFFTEQNWNIINTKSIYSGQLVNIIFSYQKENKEEQYMLCVKKKEKVKKQKKEEKENKVNIENKENKENKEDIEIIEYNGIKELNLQEENSENEEKENSNNENKEISDNEEKEKEEEEEEESIINKNYRVIGLPYKNELYEHILNNSFWEIEEDIENLNILYKEPIKIEQNIRIKNVSTGLYLSIRKKKIFDANISDSVDISSFLSENNSYEFALVDDYNLNKKLHINYNFLFFNYMLENASSEIIDEGKYILKGVFRKLKIRNLTDLGYYYESIGLNKNNTLIKDEDDFYFNIKKINIFKGFEVNYIKKIISFLNDEITDNKLINNIIINENITFFLEYLLNINYSFRDENYEYNVPIKERQVLLLKFNIIDTIYNLIDNYLKQIEQDDKFFLGNRAMLNELLRNIIKFLKFLSVNNEEIKMSIYIIILNKLLILAEMIYSDDIIILIDFIFDLIHNSEALQDYLLGGEGLLKRQIEKNEKLSSYKNNINNLLRVNKLLQYIERNTNYLLCYEKLIGLNKIQYKRDEIILLIKKHIEEVKNKSNNPLCRNYKEIIEGIIGEVIVLIKKHAILLERFKNEEFKIIRFDDDKKNNPNNKSNRRNFVRKKSIKENIIKKKTEKYSKDTRNRMMTILGSNIALVDSSKNYFKPFLESEQNIINNENNSNQISSINNLNTEKNNLIKNTLITNETTDSERVPIKGSLKINSIKSRYSGADEKSNKLDIKKSTSRRKKYSTSFSHKNLTKSGNIKAIMSESFERVETIKSEIIESFSYQKCLNKLGKICIFIKLFIEFDLVNALFIQDNFFNDIYKKDIKIEEYENPLYIFFFGKKKENEENWNFQPNIVTLYLFHLYNMLFPNIKSKLKMKIKNNRDISGMDIIEEIKNDNVDNNYEEIDDEMKYKDELRIDFGNLDEYLCVLYSIYQFCINQYVKTVYQLANIKSNFYLNFCSIDDIDKFKIYFMDTIESLLSVVVFMRKDIIEKIYSKAILYPSLLNQEFDLDNLLQAKEELIGKKNINMKKKNKKNGFSKREIILIDYLFYFLKKCDQIKYLYEKIKIYKYIKDLTIKHIKENDLNENFEDKIKELLLNILNNKRIKILLTYERLIKMNLKYSFDHHQNSKQQKNNEENEEVEKNTYIALGVDKRNEIITKLLREYEIEKYFNNIIYIESNKYYLNEDNIIKKIKKMRDHLFQIVKEIKIINNNLGKNSFLNESENKSYSFEESNQNSFVSLNRHLSQICNESGKLFDLNKILYTKKDNFSLMLSMENKFYYEKIRFIESFKYMINSLSYYKGEKGETEQNILIYCSFLLKIFNDLKNKDINFHKYVVEYYELFKILLLKSFEFISKYPKKKVREREQYLFLNICFYGIEAFLLILKNCNLYFNKTKDFMENIFSELQKLFSKFVNIKYKIIYQILYTYAVSRVLLILNRQRNYDSNSYKYFFNKIYPQDKMREFISNCVESINNNSKKENIISRKNTNIFNDKENISKLEEEDDEESLSLNIPDDDKDPLIMQDLRGKIISMDLSNVNINNLDKTKKSQEKTIFRKEENEYNAEFIRWDDEAELNRLSFNLNFLSVYVIYLNDKNSLSEDSKNEIFKTEKKNEEKEFSFNNLKDKIKYLLDYRYINSNNSRINEDTNYLISSQNEMSLIKEEKKFFGEDLGPKNLEYKFHSLLLESILNYRAKYGRNNFEIQVKKYKNKNEEYINETQRNETQIEELSFLKNNTHTNDNINNIIFYYYAPEYIDIILLEKIFNSIELKDDLMSYCIEEYNYERNTPKLLENLLENKKNYKMIEKYYEDEYNLIHNYFIQNSMEILIKQILNSFNSNDLFEIEGMDSYIFKKMGEIYSDTSIAMTEESSLKSYSLVEFLSINEDQIRSNLKGNDFLVFFDSLVYIYPKYKKSICIIYYKVGFELLSDKCKNELLSNDTQEFNQNSNTKIDLESITNILLLLFTRKSNKDLIEDKKVFSTMLNSIKNFFSYIIKKRKGFLFENVELLKGLFHKFNFVFKHLSKDFEKIVIFMKKPSNILDNNKYIKRRNKLENLLDFLIIFIEFKKVGGENILTDEINEFTGEVLKKVIKLLFILLELPNRTNIEIMDILIDFLFEVIKGPDKNNLNLLFSYGFFELVSFVIKEIDYYKLFLNFLSKDNKNEVICGITEIECKIIKIFIIYFNLSHDYQNNLNEFKKLQLWYDANFEFIRKKLKRLYYMSEKEMNSRNYNINKMLLFIKFNDDYSDYELKRRAGIYMSNYEIDSLEKENNKKRRLLKSKNKNYYKETNDDSDYCLIKFDLLLAYYSLYNYHEDLATKGRDNSINLFEKKK